MYITEKIELPNTQIAKHFNEWILNLPNKTKQQFADEKIANEVLSEDEKADFATQQDIFYGTI